jgi:ribosomal protein S18 acetylase RimI-like enzyme
MKTDDVSIRRADSNDIGALGTLVRAFRDHLGAVTPSDADLERYLPRALDDPGIEFHCAWSNGRAVGYTQVRSLASIWAPGVEAHLEDLFVLAPARRKRVGRALLRHALARARERGARRFSLDTNERNEAAQSLYRSEGLRPQSHSLYPGGREVLWVKDLHR